MLWITNPYASDFFQKEIDKTEPDCSTGTCGPQLRVPADGRSLHGSARRAGNDRFYCECCAEGGRGKPLTVSGLEGGERISERWLNWYLVSVRKCAAVFGWKASVALSHGTVLHSCLFGYSCAFCTFSVMLEYVKHWIKTVMCLVTICPVCE